MRQRMQWKKHCLHHTDRWMIWKYFAMDISLYDSTGTTKIADTTGITVTVTMPIPDALAGYAGNNKAGAVNNGVFEKLGSRLLTIDNVPLHFPLMQHIFLHMPFMWRPII